MKFISNFKYRPEIDGLRALAVLAVLFYHVGLGFPGGYIGVDIFFVISGYLITSLIIKEIQEDRFLFIQFYERRIRRIFPASAVMVLSTVLMGWFLLLPSDFIALGKSVISQTFFSSNIYFWRNTNYFAESAEFQPLLHAWSLAVEEQFYMIMPLLLWVFIKIARIHTRTKMIVILAIIFLVSLFFSMYTLPKMPAFTFYLLPTRAWELLLGSLVALIPVIPLLKLHTLRELLVVLGILGMVLPCFLYTKDTLFPGLYALPPCLGTALFIIGTSPQPNRSLPFTAKIFTWRPIIFIGLISYSLYLWHWPLVAFSKYWALEEFSTLYKWGIVALSFILGIASWRFVETPFRKKTIASGRKQLFIYALFISAVFIISGSLVILMNGFTDRFNENVLAYDKAKIEPLHKNRISLPLNLEDAKAGNFSTFGNVDSKNIDVLVWGDSHARSILPGVIAAAGSEYVVASAWHSSSAPIINYIPAQRFAGFSLGDNSPLWAEAIIAQVQKKQIPNVILVARWSGYYYAVSEESSEKEIAIDNFNDNLLKTVTALKSAGTQVWVLREVPNHHVSVPKALIKEELLGTDISPYKCSKNQLIAQNKTFDAMQLKLEIAGANLVDISELLYDEEEENYRMKYKGVTLYYDNHHLTKEGAKKVSEVFEPIFSKTNTVINSERKIGNL